MDAFVQFGFFKGALVYEDHERGYTAKVVARPTFDAVARAFRCSVWVKGVWYATRQTWPTHREASNWLSREMLKYPVGGKS